jgi:hypothetical protein
VSTPTTTRSRTIAWKDPRQLAARGRELDGLAFMEAIRDGAMRVVSQLLPRRRRLPFAAADGRRRVLSAA